MKVMIFHSYLSLPEGSQVGEDNTNRLGTLPGWHSWGQNLGGVPKERDSGIQIYSLLVL